MKTYTFPANLDSLEQIAICVMDAAIETYLSQQAIYKLRLAVDEIATNIIEHGYQAEATEGTITIEIDSDDTALTITLIDHASPFDPYSLPQPASLDLPLEEREAGGLGVWLAINAVDEFHYAYKNLCNYNKIVLYRERKA